MEMILLFASLGITMMTAGILASQPGLIDRYFGQRKYCRRCQEFIRRRPVKRVNEKAEKD
jgi:hypothetical protein